MRKQLLFLSAAVVVASQSVAGVRLQGVPVDGKLVENVDVKTMRTGSLAAFTDGFFMINEGWLGHDNGSINWIGSDGTVVYAAEAKANGNEVQLGVTSPFGQVYGGKLYVTSKQGNRFVAFDALTLKALAKIETIGEGDGRGVLAVDDKKVYIGSARGEIAIFDTATNEIVGNVSGLAEYQQVGTMERVGKYVFASQATAGLQVIDPTTDKVVKTIPMDGNSGLVVSKDGYVWLVAGSKLLRVNPVSLDAMEVAIPNSIASQWGVWKPDQICASYDENAFYYAYGGSWTQDKLGKLKILEDGTLEEDSDFQFTMPEGESNSQIFYGVIRIDPHSGNLIVATVQSGYGDNYSYNWIHWVNPKTGNIEKTVQLKDDSGNNYYWFPSLPVFPDTENPVINLDDLDFKTAEAKTIPITELVADADNLSVLATVNASVSDESIARVDYDGLNLIVTPQSQGATDLLVVVNSNGKTVEKTVNAVVSDLSSVEANAMNRIKVYPTLVDGSFRISGIDDACEVSVFNSLGMEVSRQFVENGQPVDMSGMPKGSYFVRIKVGNTVHTEKIIKM